MNHSKIAVFVKEDMSAVAFQCNVDIPWDDDDAAIECMDAAEKAFRERTGYTGKLLACMPVMETDAVVEEPLAEPNVEETVEALAQAIKDEDEDTYFAIVESLSNRDEEFSDAVFEGLVGRTAELLSHRVKTLMLSGK